MTKKENKKMKNKKIKAFSLAELLFVLGIIGILYLLVMPNQASAVAMARSIEAKSMLNQIYALEKSYNFMYTKYSNSLEEIGFEQEKLISEGGQAAYRLVIEDATSNSFLIKAEAVADFDGDGQFNVWQIDQNKVLKELVKD